jgi:kynureninase
MMLTRREWMLAVGALPLEMNALGAGPMRLPGRVPGGSLGSLSAGEPQTLPDKASFPNIRGTSLNAAAQHPRPAGGTALIRRLFAESDQTEEFRPDQNRIRENFARLINASPREIVFVPSTQSGESFVAAALGVHERGSHVVSDHLHFVGSQMMYTDMAKRGVEVTWVEMKENGIAIEDIDRAIQRGRTKLVAVSATSFVNGFQHDLKRVCEVAHAKGAMVFADIIQAAGNVPLDIGDSGVDAASCATYKWLMSEGTAFLYVRESSMARMQPPFYHWSQETTPLPTTHMYPFDSPGTQIVDDYTQKEGAAGMFSTGYHPDEMALAHPGDGRRHLHRSGAAHQLQRC